MANVRVDPSQFRPITEPVVSLTIGRQNEAKGTGDRSEDLPGRQGIGYGGVN